MCGSQSKRNMIPQNGSMTEELILEQAELADQFMERLECKNNITALFYKDRKALGISVSDYYCALSLLTTMHKSAQKGAA